MRKDGVSLEKGEVADSIDALLEAIALTPPAAPAAVQTSAAPKMAPAVPEAPSATPASVCSIR